MVFVALPALYRAQRNQQRKQDVDALGAAIIKYQSNNDGRLPFSINRSSGGSYVGQGETLDANFVRRYVDSGCSTAHRDSNYVAHDGNGREVTSSGGVDLEVGESFWGDKHYAFTGCEDTFLDPDGTPYTIVVLNGNSSGFLYANEHDHQIYVSAGRRCRDLEGQTGATAKKNDWLAIMTLEGGQSYCIDNNDSFSAAGR